MWFDTIKMQRRRKPKKKREPANIFIGEKIDDKYRVGAQEEKPGQTRARPFVPVDKDRVDPKDKTTMDSRKVLPSLGGRGHMNPTHLARIKGKSKKNKCAMCSKAMADYTARYKKKDLVGLDTGDNIHYCLQCATKEGMDDFYRVRNE